MIHEEWISNLLQERTDLKRDQLDRTRDLMDEAVPDCLITGFEELIGGITLPDPNDRHVLAAAIKADCDAIITFNLKDFPEPILDKYGIEAQHPDEFIWRQYDLKSAAVVIAAQRCRQRLKNPPKSAADYLAILERQGLPKTVGILSEFSSIL
jgi:hypothetical protein